MARVGQRRRRSARGKPVQSALAALVWGIGAGLLWIAIYAALLIHIAPESQVAVYWAVSLVMASGLLAAAVASFTLRGRGICNRLAVLPLVFVSALVPAIPASFVRMIPPSQASEWLGGILDFSTPLWASIAAIDPRQAPILGQKLVEGEVWIAIAVEMALLLLLAYGVAKLGMRQMICVVCRDICEQKRGLVRRPVVNEKAINRARKHIQNRNWGFFRDPPEAEAQPEGAELRFDIVMCRQCGASNALTVMVERPGKRDARLVKRLALSRDDVRTVIALA